MKNAIYNFLNNYCYEAILNNEELRNKSNTFYKPANDLLDLNRITDEEDCLITENITDYGSFIIELISNCPFVEININQQNKQKE